MKTFSVLSQRTGNGIMDVNYREMDSEQFNNETYYQEGDDDLSSQLMDVFKQSLLSWIF